MPAPYSGILYSRRVSMYLGGNPPTHAQKTCLTKAFEKIKKGHLKIYPHPVQKGEYYAAKCSHDIIMTTTPSNELVILDLITSHNSSLC